MRACVRANDAPAPLHRCLSSQFRFFGSSISNLSLCSAQPLYFSFFSSSLVLAPGALGLTARLLPPTLPWSSTPFMGPLGLRGTTMVSFLPSLVVMTSVVVSSSEAAEGEVRLR